MSGTYTALRTAIAATLATVTDIGVVLDRERFVVDPSKYLDLFKTTIGGKVQIRAWMIKREGAFWIFDEVFGERRRRHNFILCGYLGFEDASDTYGTLQDLADNVMAAFEVQSTLSVPGVIVHMVGPCQMRSFVTEQFGSVLTHSVEIELGIDVMKPVGTA